MNIIWILVIAFGVISSIMNKGNSKAKGTPRNMPTFGGEDERTSHPSEMREYDNDTNREQLDRFPYEEEQSSHQDYKSETNTYEVSRDIPDHRHVGMQEDIQRMNANLDRISDEKPNEWDAYASADKEMVESNAQGLANHAVNGLIWSEILGSPRSKKAFVRRRL
ncbi:hypothetical protein [Paenibacillus sp. CMAA1364]